ncbi:uncharacterized protein LOC119834111 [Zerene cesonia]|uniref:uncharacterized protein LOC119834111 n=1 Tax=Zerene cesonia TaxID=33412 RepID=UPI0018E57E17|nr:uncharacterized protein LOC119834111 [Zerene cesonia]
MALYSIDAELFISEVSKQPAIWDWTCDENKLKRHKEKAWAEIAQVFIIDFDDMPASKKVDIYRKLQGKWRNLRDNYVRSLRRKDNSSRYTHTERMSFLDVLYQHRPARSEDKSRPRKRTQHSQVANVKEDSSSHDEQCLSTTVEDRLADSSPNNLGADTESIILIKAESSSEEEDQSVIENLKRKRRVKERPEFLEMPREEEIRISSSSITDEDKLFFDSLLPVVHEFNLDQKLEFRTQILHLIKSIRSNPL